MRWSERQLAMLREIGVPPFWPTTAAPATAPPAAAPPPGPRHAPVVTAVDAAVALHAGVAEAQPVPSAQLPNLRPAPSPAKPPSPASLPRAAAPLASAAPSVALGPRPAGVESMDWPALQEAVAGCRACSLCDSRTQTVFGVGHRQARWMIVGEAPGEQEDREGEPFVGRAGQLLDRMLAALGLTRGELTRGELTRGEGSPRHQVYIANVLKCRPPANRNPLPQEVAQCEPFLLRQMALVQPDLVLAMGRFAVQSLLKTTEPLGKLRGRVHEVQGVPVVVTYHPAYLLRNPADKALAWDDLCLARELQAARAAAR